MTRVRLIKLEFWGNKEDRGDIHLVVGVKQSPKGTGRPGSRMSLKKRTVSHTKKMEMVYKQRIGCENKITND